MIKIKKLNKYYNYGKPNQIHVINNTSIELEGKGLVMFLGPSGCGKTTLLNVIGGMDKYSSGEISYDDEVLSKRKIDEFRAKEIGFIFQNYNLLNEKTVYENLKLVLNMFYLTKEEVEERIEFALKAVNMENYKRRLVRQLSGGQQQRIAIARALVKSPKLIIADEPTGNLDEKNTTQIMNIIKKLSKECLVIMVTHERRLAEFYATRIVELKDGSIISDNQNTTSNTYVTKDDVNIYLQDMENVTFSDQEINIRYFYTTKKPTIKIDVVYHNDTIYFKANSDDDKIKFKYLNKKSENVLIDGKKPELKLEDIDDVVYEMPKLEKTKVKKSVIPFKESFKAAKDQMSNLRFKKKLMLVVYALTAIMIVFAVGTFGKAFFIEEDQFMNSSRNLVVLQDDNLTLEKVLKIENNEKTEILPATIFDFNCFNFKLHSEQATITYLSEFNALPINEVKSSDLIVGSIPKNRYEIVIDIFLINIILKNNMLGYYGDISQAGYDLEDQLIGQYLSFSSYGDKYDIIIGPIAPSYENSPTAYKIVGVSNTFQPVIFTLYNDIKNYYFNSCFSRSYNFYTQNGDYFYPYIELGTFFNYTYIDYYNRLKFYTEEEKEYTYYDESEVLINQKLQNNEIIISKSLKETFFTNSFTFIKDSKVFKIAGYSDDLKSNEIIMNQNSFDNLYYDLIVNSKKFAVNVSDKEAFILKYNDYNLFDNYLDKLNNYKETIIVSTIVFGILSAILLSVSLIFLYFTIRSNLITRITEIGVYRSVGVRKNNILGMFLIEISLILLFSSFIGYILGGYIITKFFVDLPFSIFIYNFYSWIVSFILIIGINLFAGLLPVILLLKLTPYQIITKYDM